MNYYKKLHQYYCGIDLHARKMYVCIIDQEGNVKLHQNIKTEPGMFLTLVAPFCDDIVVGVECVFCWYWLSDLCSHHQIPFVLGHALYMKAIHGGKTKNDKVDSFKLASLLRSGNFPVAYAYPAEMRATRDLLVKQSDDTAEVKIFILVIDWGSFCLTFRGHIEVGVIGLV